MFPIDNKINYITKNNFVIYQFELKIDFARVSLWLSGKILFLSLTPFMFPLHYGNISK